MTLLVLVEVLGQLELKLLVVSGHNDGWFGSRKLLEDSAVLY